MNGKRIFSALGGSYRQRLAAEVPSLSPPSIWAWANRGTIPGKYRQAVDRALEAHALEVVATLAELRKEKAEATLSALRERVRIRTLYSIKKP